MCLKTIEKIGKDKEKNHTCKLTSNLEGKTPYIHVRCDMRLARQCAGCAQVLVSVKKKVQNYIQSIADSDVSTGTSESLLMIRRLVRCGVCFKPRHWQV